MKLCVFAWVLGMLCYLLAYLAVLIVCSSSFIYYPTFLGTASQPGWSMELGLGLDGMGMWLGYSMKICDIQSLL